MDSQYNYISPEDLDVIISHIPDLGIRKWKDNDVKHLFKRLYWCGMRPMEGINVMKEDVNLEDRSILLRNTKTQKREFANIAVPYIEELRDYLRTKTEGRLIAGLTYPPFYSWITRLGKICNIEAWTTFERDTGEKTKGHIFRKSLGKDMLIGTHGKKFDIPIIANQLRHKSPATTMNNYLKASNEAVKEAWG